MDDGDREPKGKVAIRAADVNDGRVTLATISAVGLGGPGLPPPLPLSSLTALLIYIQPGLVGGGTG